MARRGSRFQKAVGTVYERAVVAGPLFESGAVMFVARRLLNKSLKVNG